jgi:hypothetical protein
VDIAVLGLAFLAMLPWCLPRLTTILRGSRDSGKDRTGAMVFTLAIGGLAVADYYREKPLDPAFVGLVTLAVLPWALPWLATLMKTMKVAGMELTFRELEAQIKDTREVAQAAASVVTGVGKAPAMGSATATAPNPDALSHSAFAADDEDVPRPVQTDSDAANALRFGNKPVAGRRRLSATIKPFPGSGDLFMVHAWVSSTELQPLKDGTRVTFYLHPSFKPNDVVTVEAVNGEAAIDRVTWGWFTVGAQVDGVELGLPLNTVSGAPPLFKSR